MKATPSQQVRSHDSSNDAYIDVLSCWPDMRADATLAEIESAIQGWREAGRTPEIAYCGVGRVGNGFGHYAILGSRLNGGYLDGQTFAITAFDLSVTQAFAERYGILLVD